MMFDTPIPTTSEELTRLEREDQEALERMQMRSAPKPEPEFPIEHVREMDRMSAGTLVLLLRNAEETALSRDELERSRLAQAGRRVAAELLAGARKLERYRPDDSIPAYLLIDSDVPLTDLTRKQAS